MGLAGRNKRTDLSSKVHHCVNVVLGEQVADEVCALDVSLDQLHVKTALSGCPRLPG